MTERDLLIESIDSEFDRDEGIRQASNVFGYDEEDYESEDDDEDEFWEDAVDEEIDSDSIDDY